MSTSFPSPAAELQHLFEMATPELYRRNSFRVLGLSIAAETGEARRRQKKLKRKEALGLDDSSGGGILPLSEAPDREALQHAQQRVQDPMMRLVDEIFWFWPAAEGEADDALDLLHAGKLEEARQSFLDRESRGADPIAIHNLAVLDHLIALDAELDGNGSPTSPGAKARDACWRDSLRRWRQVLELPETWSRLQARIEELADPRLGRDFAAQLQSALGEVILLVNARLAVRGLEQGCRGEVARQLWLLRSTGFRFDLASDAVRRALAPIDHRIRRACEKVDNESDLATIGAKGAEELVKLAAPLLSSIDAMLPADDPFRLGLHDEIARVGLRALIAFGNHSKNWIVAKRGLADLIAQVHPSDALQQRLRENLETMTINASETLCHYCEAAEGDPAFRIGVNMYGNVKRTPIGFQEVRITWNHLTIQVPRCAKCQKVHQEQQETFDNYNLYGLLTAGGEIAFAVALAFILPSSEATIPLLLMGGAIVMVATLFGFIFLGTEQAEACRPASVKAKENVDDHPQIVARRRDEWKFGLGPEDGTTFVMTPPETPPTESSAGSGGDSVLPSAAGCPKCGTEHWWAGGTCSLCDAPPASAAGVDVKESLQGMIDLLALGPVVMSRVISAINDGRRGTAASLLITAGKSPAEARKIILGWEQRPKDS